MLGELVAGVEAEHSGVHPVAPMYDLGDNRTPDDRDRDAGAVDRAEMRNGWGYGRLVREVGDSVHLRRFCLIGLG